MATKWNKSDTTAVLIAVSTFLLMLGTYELWSYWGLVFASGLVIQGSVICRCMTHAIRKLL